LETYCSNVKEDSHLEKISVINFLKLHYFQFKSALLRDRSF